MDLPSFANIISAEAENLKDISLHRLQISNKDRNWRELKDPLPSHTGAYVDEGYLYVVNFSEEEGVNTELLELAEENNDFANLEETTIDLLSERNWNLTSHILNEALQYIARSKNNLEVYKGHIYLDEVLETVEDVDMYPELVTKFIRDTDQKKVYLQVEFKPFLRPHKHEKIHKFTCKPKSKQRMEWMEKAVEEFRNNGDIRIILNEKTVEFSEYLKFSEEVIRTDA